MLVIILVGIALYGLYYLLGVKPFKHWSDRGINSLKSTPFFGDSYRLFMQKESISEMMVRLYQSFPGTRYTGIYQFGTPTLLIKDPELIKQMFIKDFDHFMDHRNILPDNGNPIWTKNLASLKGKKWRDMRGTLSPSFTASKMKTMFALMNECSENFIKYFESKNNEDVIELELKDTFTRYANDIIATTAFGVKCNSVKDRNNQFYLSGLDIANFKSLPIFLNMLNPTLAKMLNLDMFSKKSTSFFLNLIKETIAFRKQKNVVRPDMLQLLIEARNPDATNKVFADDDPREKVSEQELSDIDIAAQALIFFFAGFDSVSTLMSFTSYELATHPDIQQRLYEEICEVRDSCNGQLTYEGVMKMTYMDMIISEVLRKWPPFPTLDRICTKPYTIEPVNKDEIPLRLKPGDPILLPVYALHMDPQYFPDPEKFDPERFSEDNKKCMNPYAYNPFGSGPRICIGQRYAIMEVKAVFYYLLTQFEIVPTAKSIIPLKLSRKSFLNNAEGGYWFGLKKRQNV